METNENEFYATVMGALLHDIGRFVQRAQSNPMVQDHSSWGEKWFQDYLAKKLPSSFGEKETEIIRSAIRNHHENENIVSLSDAISIGTDRITLIEEEGEGGPFRNRLLSIFSRVSISGQPSPEKFSQVAPLGKDRLKEIFPVDDRECSTKEYASLLEGLKEEVGAADLNSLSPRNFIDFLYFLLWKYCWCIPNAPHKIEAEVPLFEHLKTTAAIAGCLFAYRQENPAEILNSKSRAFFLIGGDISGIQSYIFDVLTQQGKIAKRLRARSFFVQIISEIASHKILNAFRLPLCNLVLSAGGNFYILAPNLRNGANVVKTLQKEFDDWALEKLNGELSLSIATVELSGKDLADFSKAFEDLKMQLTLKRYQQLKKSLCEGGKWLIPKFIRPEVIEGDEKACHGCHKYPIKASSQNGDRFCERCSDDARIGQLLPKARYLAFFDNNHQGFEILNYSFELWEDVALSKAAEGRPYLILALNNPEVRLPVTGFKYIANHIPTTLDVASEEVEEGQPVTLNDIAKCSKGDKLIGYLKADVDNMGMILRKGFQGTNFSISRISTFSRLLETFFAGHLQVRMEREFKENYTVFSGGDDFFVIGPWNRSIELAGAIRKDFSLFCANNSDLTLSAGIYLMRPHEPVSYCADVVEEKLRSSKRKEGKDRITLFDQTVSWIDLEEKILKTARQIISWLESEPPIVSRSFINNLRRYGEMAENSNIYAPSGGVKTEFLKFVPMLVYDLKRNLTNERQKVALDWAEELIPKSDRPQGGKDLEFLRTIMDYVLTYTRS